MGKKIINPAWKWHNDTYNEGGEGYNPHPKWIDSEGKPEVVSVTPSNERLISVPGISRLLRESEVRASIAEAQERLTRLTDPSAIRITKEGIAAYTKALGE